MHTSANQRFVAWAILIACLIAIPVGLTTKAPPVTDNQNQTKKKWSWLGGGDRLQVVRLSGMIYEDEESQSPFLREHDTPSYVKKQLRRIIENDSIKGVLLRINSPGGTVATSQEIYQLLQEVRKKGKPVVVSMGDVAASGGYYIAAGADKIVSCPGTLTGSIGVIMHLLNWQETEKKIGLQPVVIKSGTFKDIGSGDRQMTPEERELLQAIIMDSYDQFVSAVSEGRKMDKEVIKKLADGRIYSGRQALKNKLVDAVGGYDQALAMLQKMTREKFALNKDLPVDEDKFSSMFAQFFDVSAKSATPAQVLSGILPQSFQTRFHKQPLWLME